MSGWIKLHRSLLDWEWYDDVNTRLVFVHCLLQANFKDRSHKGTMFERGSFPCGRDQLAKDVGISTQQLRTSLNKLKSTGELTIKSTNKGTKITLCNYDSYQDMQPADQPTNNQQVTNDQPASNHSIRKKERKKERKEEKPKPTQDEIIDYLLTKMPEVNPEWTPERIKRAGASMYEDWVDNGWKDGNNKPIVNWKSKAKNTLAYKKPWNFGSTQQQTSSQHNPFKSILD